jgi:DNA-binding HxlR family transcriptional regulator
MARHKTGLSREAKFRNAVDEVKRAVSTVLDMNIAPMGFQALHGNVSCSAGILEQSLKELLEEGSVCKMNGAATDYRHDVWGLEAKISTKPYLDTIKRLEKVFIDQTNK